MILEALIGALAPVAVDGVKRIINFKTGGAKPVTVDEQIRLDTAEIEKLKALAEIDRPSGNPSQWVVDLRASSRYVCAGACIFAGGIAVFLPVDTVIKTTCLELANIALGFLFGARIISNHK